MKLDIDRDALLQGLSRAQGIVERRSTMPILSNCLLSAQQGELIIAATDLQVSCRSRFPATVQEEGAVTVPAANFFNIVRELPAAPVSLDSTDEARLVITLGEARYQLLGLPVEQFPPIAALEEEATVEVDTVLVKEMIDKVIFSVSVDDLQPHLNGVHWEKLDDNGIIKIRMVSSDGHRLSLVDRDFPGGERLSWEGSILIPRKGMVEIQRFVADEATCSLGLMGRNLIVTQTNKTLLVKLLDKKFPDYRRIIPSHPRLAVTLGRQEFFDILKRLSSLSSERFKGVRLILHADRMEIIYNNPEVGEGREVLPVKIESTLGMAGEEVAESEDSLELPLEIGYNARYLMEPLNVMTGAEVKLAISSQRKPLCLRAVDDAGYLGIVMPMDLSD